VLEALIEVMLRRGVGPAAVERRAGLDRGFLEQVNQGHEEFNWESLDALCAALDVSPGDLTLQAEAIARRP
jgi:DNA-binding Xre family transcriptional regulator